MKAHSALLLATLNLAAAAASAQEAPGALSRWTHTVCGGAPSQIESAIADLLRHPISGINSPDLNLLRTVIAAYRPDTRDAQGTVGVLTHFDTLPSAADLGGEVAWQGVRLQTPELRRRAFGEQSDCPAPVARFDHGPAHLSFVATEHVSQLPNVRDAVFRTLKNEFEYSHAQAVIVEGYPERFPCTEAVRIFLTPADQLATEPEYLAKLALDQGALVSGGEPDELGLSSPDRENFQLLRQLTTFHGISAQEAYRRVQQQFSFGPLVSFSQFTGWYRRTNGRDFSLSEALSDITPSYNLPPGTPARGTNRMSDQVDLNRDSQITRVVRRDLLTRGRVLVAYGRDHFPRQLPVYEAVFGTCAPPVARCFSGAAAPALQCTTP